MKRNTYKSVPNISGYFGKYGGRFVAETLVPLILEVEKAYKRIKKKKNLLKNSKNIYEITLEDHRHYITRKI